jgi:hydrocephalus-inducing protein
MMFAGKRVEVVFEYLPEETVVAESFFKFRIPSMGLTQMFLFTGKVSEPKVLFSSSKIDFHSVMLGGEGSAETIYLENSEHLPFQFAVDKYSLMQLEGPNGPVLDIVPKQGNVPPHGRIAINLLFHPQEEVVYNFNIVVVVKRKPLKLSLNVKGEGYAVHPFIQLEQEEAEGAPSSASTSASTSTTPSGRYLTLRPSPAVNYADFGAVQVLDTITKTLTVANNGKFNFDYCWDIGTYC